MADNDYYTGDKGARYLEQRRGAQSEHVQALRASLFLDLGGADLTVLDFGCGTGGVISRLDAARRVGIEVSPVAASKARSAGVEVYESLDCLPAASVDVAISFHAIEHVDSPLDVLKSIRRVVKPGGRVRLVVPCETPLLAHERVWKDNSDRHLYTWTPLLFGNLAQRAGYTSIVSRVEPMPTGSRMVHALRWLPPLRALTHTMLAVSRNWLNVVLDARAS